MDEIKGVFLFVETRAEWATTEPTTFLAFIIIIVLLCSNNEVEHRSFASGYVILPISVIISCQRAVLKELKLGPNIARNTALSENVFMMVVCIELRIPLFVVGKPGSSKSLAKTVVADNMQGDAARSELFKTFKQVMRLLRTY